MTRSQASARRAVRFIGRGQAHAGINRQALASRFILIATPDLAVAQIAEELARIGAEEWKGKTVLHTSGALASSILEPLRAYGAAVGSVHPLQTFSGVGVPPLEGRVFAIEGDAAALRFARLMVRALGGQVVQIPVAGKAAYHAAASMAAGQVLTLMEAATNLMMSLGMKRREALRALLPLTRQVLDNFERLGPRAAWTGPLARGDYAIIESHETALREFPAEYRNAYEQLNRLAARVLAQNPEETISQLEESAREKNHKAKSMGRQA